MESFFGVGNVLYLYVVVFSIHKAVSVEAVVLFGDGGLLYMIHDVVLANTKLLCGGRGALGCLVLNCQG